MISVIIPIYNVENYLEKCIGSIIQNSYKDLELICVNDGSRDNCIQILRRLSGEDPRIVVLNQDHQGVCAARNNGLKAATGEYIAFVDSDDWVHPQYFQFLVECMGKKQADIVLCGCQTFHEKDEIIVNEYSDIKYQRLSDQQFFASYYARHMCWGKLYRRSSIDKLLFESEVKLGEDTLFNLCVVSNMENPVVFEIDALLYYYFQRSDSIAHTITYRAYSDLSEWVAAHYMSEGWNKWSWMPVMQAVKMALSYRCGAILYKNRTDIVHAEEMLKKLRLMMRSNPLISRKDKIIHSVMIRFPGIYWRFRIKDDPTMKIWESDVRGNKNR